MYTTNFQIWRTDTSIIFGSNTVDAFISAPNAINSGVEGSAQIRGSVWLKEWDAANGNHIVIKGGYKTTYQLYCGHLNTLSPLGSDGSTLDV